MNAVSPDAAAVAVGRSIRAMSAFGPLISAAGALFMNGMLSVVGKQSVK
jgi:hypothetical protein